MLTPSFWSKLIPETSSKQTTSYWHTKPRWPGAHRAAFELALDDLQALLDLALVGAGAIAPEQELADVGGHRILALETAHQILADDEAVECLGGDLVECVELHGSISTDGHGLFGHDLPIPNHHEHRSVPLVLFVRHQQGDGAVLPGWYSSALRIEHG